MRLFAIAILALSQAHGSAISPIDLPLAQPSMRVAAIRASSLNSADAQQHRQEVSTDTSKPPGPTISAKAARVSTVCRALTAAAQTNGIPLDFLTRVIWQESRFRPNAVSPVGAQGVAQFMPATANDMGLADPFDAADAIAKSADLLHRLKHQFGNWGLAAAAYNAGPKRVEQWVASRRSVPTETRNYVQSVTGRTIESWTQTEQSSSAPSQTEEISCPKLVTLLIGRSSLPAVTSAFDHASPRFRAAWVIQLLGDTSQPAILAAYRRLQTQYRTVLGDHEPLVVRSPIGRSGYWYRVRIAANSRPDAEKLCTSLRAKGGNCLVQHN